MASPNFTQCLLVGVASMLAAIVFARHAWPAQPPACAQASLYGATGDPKKRAELQAACRAQLQQQQEEAARQQQQRNQEAARQQQQRNQEAARQQPAKEEAARQQQAREEAAGLQQREQERRQVQLRRQEIMRQRAQQEEAQRTQQQAPSQGPSQPVWLQQQLYQLQQQQLRTQQVRQEQERQRLAPMAALESPQPVAAPPAPTAAPSPTPAAAGSSNPASPASTSDSSIATKTEDSDPGARVDLGIRLTLPPCPSVSTRGRESEQGTVGASQPCIVGTAGFSATETLLAKNTPSAPGFQNVIVQLPGRQCVAWLHADSCSIAAATRSGVVYALFFPTGGERWQDAIEATLTKKFGAAPDKDTEDRCERRDGTVARRAAIRTWSTPQAYVVFDPLGVTCGRSAGEATGLLRFELAAFHRAVP